MNAFEALGLNEQLVQAITDLGFDTPTPIQEKAIPVLLSGTTDFVVGLHKPEPVKPLHLVPLLNLNRYQSKHPQALIVCPTRNCVYRSAMT
jgi:ATP-dependent RNA helicase DeaD